MGRHMSMPSSTPVPTSRPRTARMKWYKFTESKKAEFCRQGRMWGETRALGLLGSRVVSSRALGL